MSIECTSHSPCRRVRLVHGNLHRIGQLFVAFSLMNQLANAMVRFEVGPLEVHKGQVALRNNRRRAPKPLFYDVLHLQGSASITETTGSNRHNADVGKEAHHVTLAGAITLWSNHGHDYGLLILVACQCRTQGRQHHDVIGNCKAACHAPNRADNIRRKCGKMGADITAPRFPSQLIMGDEVTKAVISINCSNDPLLHSF
mmetsp:Transcript_61138/g.158128  ORF Transcript_61138/g.158128 Transcript_61138/m.158128 type:complete len:200 (-) Transcript_61138:1050-1649(-)